MDSERMATKIPFAVCPKHGQFVWRESVLGGIYGISGLTATLSGMKRSARHKTSLEAMAK
jgi:hypothetical protein